MLQMHDVQVMASVFARISRQFGSNLKVGVSREGTSGGWTKGHRAALFLSSKMRDHRAARPMRIHSISSAVKESGFRSMSSYSFAVQVALITPVAECLVTP